MEIRWKNKPSWCQGNDFQNFKAMQSDCLNSLVLIHRLSPLRLPLPWELHTGWLMTGAGDIMQYPTTYFIDLPPWSAWKRCALLQHLLNTQAQICILIGTPEPLLPCVLLWLYWFPPRTRPSAATSLSASALHTWAWSCPPFEYGQVENLHLTCPVSMQPFTVDNSVCRFSFKCVKPVSWFRNKNIQIPWFLISMHFVDRRCYFTIPLRLLLCCFIVILLMQACFPLLGLCISKVPLDLLLNFLLVSIRLYYIADHFLY